MHGAPSVNHPVGRSRFAGLLAGALWLAAAAGIVLWSLQVDAGVARLAAALAILAATGAFASIAWLRSPSGLLAWNGEAWNWCGAEEGEPRPVLDLQQVLLLRWQAAAGRTRWLWAERRTQPASWDDFRRAVYSRARR